MTQNLKHGIDVETLLEGLPACTHCRASRRRCDTKLPSCENCAKNDRECTYYDHVLNEELPRNYIASLVQHLEAIEDRHGPTPEPSATKGASQNPVVAQHHFAFSQGSYRYLGKQSPLLDIYREKDGSHESPHKGHKPSFPSQAMMGSDGVIAPVWHGYLIRIFFDSFNDIYPILDPSLPWLSPGAVMGLEAHPTQAFILQMVYAIACHCDSGRSSSLMSLASAAHGRALQLIDRSTAEQSTSTLQVAILLVLYALFNPASGNVSQQLGFAIRLAIDLAGSEGDEDSTLLATLHKVIYCLENDVCSVLVRPTSLPEPSTPLRLATEDPLEFLCGLYRVQSRIRHNILDGTLRSAVLSIPETTIKKLHPNSVANLWETRLMLEPSASIAIRLIAAYSQDGYIATFLTAHRVHRASILIIDGIFTAEGLLKYDLILSYGTATALLGRWSGMWEAANILLADIQLRMGARGSQHR